MGFKKLVGLIIYLLLATTSYSQSLINHSKDISNYDIRNYGVDEGIDGIQVHDLFQDEDGFLWVVSTTSLLRFDGLKLFPFSNEKSGGTIYDITKYENGTFLLSMFGGGIQVFEGDSLSTFYDSDFQAAKTLTVDEEKNIYAGTYGDGLFILEKDSVVKHLTTENGLVSNEIWKLFLDSNGRIWVGTNQGLSIIDGEKITNFTSENGLTESVIRDIEEVSNGEVWVGSNGGGIAVFKDNEIIRKITQKDGLKNDFVYSINENMENSTIWIGHRGEGGITKLSDGSAEHYSIEDGLISDQINNIEFLKNGEVAIATENGLSLLVPKKIDMLSTEVGRIYDLETVLVKQDSSRNIWVGSYSNGFKVLSENGWENFESPPLKTNGYTQSATAAVNGDVWFGTQGSGIIQVRNKKIVNTITSKEGISDDYVRGLEFDNEGNLWVCTNSGIDKLDVNLQVLKSYGDKDLPNSFCTTIIKDNAGEIWAGTFGGGVVKFEPDSIKVFDEVSGLKSNQVIALYSDTKSDIWVGTLVNGISKISSEEVINFDLTSGVPQANYAGFKEDKEGHFWMATGNGIVRSKTEYFDDYQEGKINHIPFQLYIKEDGMLTDNMQTANNSTIELLHNGDLLFATTSGVVVINTEKSDYSNSVFFPYMSEVSKDGQKMLVRDNYEFDSNSKIELSYSALNFTAPYKTEFRIRLVGLDSDWVPVGDRSSAFYDYLPDGNYTFSVSAKGPDGQWNEKTANLSFTILPPFYKTWWFYSFSVMLFTGLIVGLMQIKSNIKVKKLNRELLYQQKLNQEKERISRDLHDNVGSQITNLITGIEISSIHIGKGDQEQAGQILKNLDEDARNTMTDLRETIWLLDKEEVSFQDFEKHLKSYIRRQKRYFEGLDMSLTSDIEKQIILDPSQSLNLMRIIQEALNNARKYAEANNIELHFTLNDNRITCGIKDDGKGMIVDEALESGNGLRNMAYRAEEMDAEFRINSTIDTGTEVTLQFEVKIP